MDTRSSPLILLPLLYPPFTAALHQYLMYEMFRDICDESRWGINGNDAKAPGKLARRGTPVFNLEEARHAAGEVHALRSRLGIVAESDGDSEWD
ncbi:hypothetical protein QBC46DRAFT_392211 [Diplogelasinospora grovesii]|uniref:Uncharacterized protein n=1 Tax=Diplogelasinospora grovesii TaxID=303347 RepID=A0AAN6N1T5_9PEZI|nr:hypothetical protein QBC46DRAFT_392211 [Diplogelasinospora grovesii]